MNKYFLLYPKDGIGVIFFGKQKGIVLTERLAKEIESWEKEYKMYNIDECIYNFIGGLDFKKEEDVFAEYYTERIKNVQN